MTVPTDLVASLVGVGALTAVATLVLALLRVPHMWAPATAVARGVVQLAIISVILTGIVTNPALIGAALLVMYTIAAFVSAGRIERTPRMLAVMATSIAAGVGIALTIVFATGAIELAPRYALALGAIVLGNSMSVATLVARTFVGSVSDRWDEVEGWLAIGATPRAATLTLARRAVREALIPSIDQTRTTGLVVLPGAFVGAIFGGLSPIEAGRFQIVVLAAIMAAGSITTALVVTWLGAVRTRPQTPR